MTSAKLASSRWPRRGTGYSSPATCKEVFGDNIWANFERKRVCRGKAVQTKRAWAKIGNVKGHAFVHIAPSPWTVPALHLRTTNFWSFLGLSLSVVSSVRLSLMVREDTAPPTAVHKLGMASWVLRYTYSFTDLSPTKLWMPCAELFLIHLGISGIQNSAWHIACTTKVCHLLSEHFREHWVLWVWPLCTFWYEAEMKQNGLKDPPTRRIQAPSYLPTEGSFYPSLKPVSPSQPLWLCSQPSYLKQRYVGKERRNGEIQFHVYTLVKSHWLQQIASSTGAVWGKGYPRTLLW